METAETDLYTRQRSIDHGIERTSYYPKQRRYDTPIVMQHGMWHGAWCWQWWQELFAEWGWESHAHSLPGHAGSPVRRPIRFCTLGYYLGFLKAEVQRLDRRPVLIGHSMGGALTQWYLKYAGDDLPAAVLLGAWNALGNYDNHGGEVFWKLDPIGLIMAAFTWSATPFIRDPQHATRLLYSERGVYSPQEFHAHLGPESLFVMAQYSPPLWTPPQNLKTPLLVVAGECDAVISVESQRRSAAHYRAPLIVIPGASHNMMMEHNRADTARSIHDWIRQQGVQ